MPPAVVAGIGAAATIGGAVLGAKANKKAAKTAAATEAQNSAANIALARENYANNASRLDPIAAQGALAGSTLSASLGLGGPNAGVDWEGYVNAHPDALEDRNLRHADKSLAEYGKWHYAQDGSRRDLTAFGAGNGALAAFDKFRDSGNYKFRLAEGNKAFTQGVFARGMGESGAAIKGAIDYNQSFAANEFSNWQQQLAQQQQFGLAGASALAGVGQNMVNGVTAANNASSSAAANAALIRGQSNNAMYGSIAGALGTFAGSSFKPSTVGLSTGAPTTASWTGPRF